MAGTLRASVDADFPTKPRPEEPVDEGPADRVLVRELALVWIVAAVTYALTLSSVPALTHDSLTYLQAIESGGDALWHPHHLLYNAIGAGWLRTFRAFGVTADALKVVALANAAFGATSAALCYALLRRRARLPRGLAVIGTLGASLSFGVWFYSVSVEVYLLPLALLLGATYVLMAPRLTGRHLLLVGVLHGLAVLSHQVHVLYAVVVIAVVLGRRHELGADAVRRGLVRWAAALTGLVAAGYALVLAIVVRPSTLGEAASWLTRYADDDTYWLPPGPATLPSAAFGAARAVVGGHFVFRLGAVRDGIHDAFPERSLTDETFLVRNLAPVAAVALVVVALVAGALLAGVLVRGYRDRRQQPEAVGRLARALVAWMVAYTGFFLVWEPSNLEFWIPQVTAAWLLAAASCAAPLEGGTTAIRARARRGTLLGVAAVMVGAANLVGSILPAVDAANDAYAARFTALGQLIGAGDAVVVDRPHLAVGYTRRHTAATPIPGEPYATRVGTVDAKDEFDADDVVDQVEAVLDGGHRVVVEGELIDDPVSDEAEEASDALSDAYGDRWQRIETVAGTDWLLIEPSIPALPAVPAAPAGSAVPGGGGAAASPAAPGPVPAP